MKGLIFTYALTYGGAVMSLIDPFLGLLIYICFAIVRPADMWSFSVAYDGNYSRIVAIGLLIGWALHGFGRWDLRRAGGITFAFAGYWIWCIVGSFQAENTAVAWNHTIEITKILLPFLVGITLVDSIAKLKQIAWVIALSQGYVAYELNAAYYQDGFNRVHELGFGGGDNNCVAIAMVAGAGLAFFLGLHSKTFWARAAAFLSALLMVHTVMLSFSRGGMVALCILGGVSFWLIPKRAGHFVWLALAIVAALYLAGPQVRERFFTSFASESERDYNAQSRVEMWKICWNVMLQHPLFGLGPRHFPINAARFGLTPGKEAHSLWFQFGAEHGFVGLGFLLLFYGLCICRLWPLAKERTRVSDPWMHYFARMVIASLVGFAVAAQFVTLVSLELPYYVALVGAGALKLHAQADAQPAPARQIIRIPPYADMSTNPAATGSAMG